MHRIFVYGTLKRHGSNHRQLAGQRFVSEALTSPGYVLYQLDGYPGMVADVAAESGVTGELWEITDECLARLDDFEGVGEGLYRREAVPLAEPRGVADAEAYVYARSVAGRRRIGAAWPIGRSDST